MKDKSYDGKTYGDGDLIGYITAYKLHQDSKEKLVKRIEYICKLICKTFGTTFQYMCYDTPLIINKDDDCIMLEIYSRKANLATSNWNYSDGFPLRFLFMNDDEIVQVVQEDRRQDLEQKKLKKQKSADNDENFQKLKKLLSNEEKRLKKELGVSYRRKLVK